MMVWYVIKFRKQLVYFNWMHHAVEIQLKYTREGSKTCSINGNTKLMQHRFLKSLVSCLLLDRIGHSEKKTKVVSIEHKKLLSLENN